jgi:lipopolysaccharide export LptBFGC system permease protein LptF
MESGAYQINLEELNDRNRNRGGFSQRTLSELLADKRELSEKSALRTEVSKRFSFSLASFAFALIAVPLAVTAHRKETSIGFLFSLLVASGYFFFIIIANSVRDNPRWYPEYLMWVPNVLFITLGAILFWRLSKR